MFFDVARRAPREGDEILMVFSGHVKHVKCCRWADAAELHGHILGFGRSGRGGLSRLVRLHISGRGVRRTMVVTCRRLRFPRRFWRLNRFILVSSFLHVNHLRIDRLGVLHRLRLLPLLRLRRLAGERPIAFRLGLFDRLMDFTLLHNAGFHGVGTSRGPGLRRRGIRRGWLSGHGSLLACHNDVRLTFLPQRLGHFVLPLAGVTACPHT